MKIVSDPVQFMENLFNLADSTWTLNQGMLLRFMRIEQYLTNPQGLQLEDSTIQSSCVILPLPPADRPGHESSSS